ncbi:alpha/beta hydrolase-fold protein [Chitinophaga barathri]|uniref:Esterase n=1 Tax=Chitinophaga barathri TaxID=1647451 RepID=A0A3N4MCJ4_9BACT|nr:alpha/beta hydrolase-fold protein [Chitinophaga barathri]RPD41421.1 hypothetical protein EG028_08870 [Chitinophaga barathri]
MRYLVFLILVVTGIQRSSAQDKIKESLYAASLKDSVRYTVYFPEDWEGWHHGAKHPVLYAINYGMVEGNYLQAQVSYFRKSRIGIPNSLIVVVEASMKRMGYSYETGNLSAEGLHFVDFIKKELIPSIEKKYNTSTFRAYIGHSFAASFGNYLFLNRPGLFNGYMMLAPEKTGEEQPPFHLSDEAKDYYNHHHTFYYTAVGQFDLQRRHAYAREIQRETRQLDTTRFFFRYDSLSLANHNNILTLAIEFALEHTYQFYTPYSGKEETDAVKDLEAISARVHDMYGIELEKNYTFYAPFAQEAITNKDSAGLVTILKYFDSDHLKGWNIMHFGQYCLQLKLKDNARQYFERAMKKIEKEEMNIAGGPENLLFCYNLLAFDIYEQKPEKGWAYLQKGLLLSNSDNKYLPGDGRIYFDLGKLSAIHNYKVKEGLQYLLTYISDDTRSSIDMAHYYIAQNYILLNQRAKAKPHLTKALELNSNNKPAARLLKEM